MADENSLPEQAANGADNLPAVGLLAQYVKDLSFENPNAPAVFQWQDQPEFDIQVNLNIAQIADDVHEVSIKFIAKATAPAGIMFAVELDYGALFGIQNVPDDQLQPFLVAEAPRLVFPFARRVLADVVRDGGFPPLLLDPIDFGALYMQQVEAAEASGAVGNA